MGNSATVQLIQDNSNARARLLNWFAGSALSTSLAGVAMPVLLYRGHSLTKAVALGALVNGVALGGVVTRSRRMKEYLSKWECAKELELLQSTDLQITPYLADFPQAYRVVAVGNKVTAVGLKELWQRCHMPKQILDERDKTVKTGVYALGGGSALLLGLALTGRRLQGLRPWQRWMTVTPCSATSVGLGALFWAFRVVGLNDQKAEYVKHTLGRVIVSESRSSTVLSQPLIALLEDKEVSIAKFHADPFTPDTLAKIASLIRPCGFEVAQDEQNWVSFSRSP